MGLTFVKACISVCMQSSGRVVCKFVPYFIRNFSLLSFGEEAEEEEEELSSVNKVSEFCGFSLFTPVVLVGYTRRNSGKFCCKKIFLVAEDSKI